MFNIKYELFDRFFRSKFYFFLFESCEAIVVIQSSFHDICVSKHMCASQIIVPSSSFEY